MYVDTVVSGHGGDRHCRPHSISRRIPEEDEDGDGQGSGPNIEEQGRWEVSSFARAVCSRIFVTFLEGWNRFLVRLRLERGRGLRGLRRLADYHLCQSPRCSYL